MSAVLSVTEGGEVPAADRVGRALGWSLLATGFARIWSFASGVVLAWLLVPTDYAVFAIAALVLTVLLSVNELGVTVAVLRHPGDPTHLLGTARTIALGFSVVLYALIFASAPILASQLGVPESATFIRVLAIGVVIDGIASVPGAMLSRQFNQLARTRAEIIGTLCGSAVMVAAALCAAAAWSFVAGTLAGSAVTAALILRASPELPRARWDTAVASELVRISVPFAGASLLALAMLNVDYVVVARQLDRTSLGLYVFAFNISNWLPAILALAIRRVAIPAFASLQDAPERAATAFARTLGLVVSCAGVLTAALAIGAPALIGVLYDEAKWGAAVPALRVLAILGFVRVILDLAYDLLIGLGRGRIVALLQALWLAVLVPSLIIGSEQGGIQGVAFAHVLVSAGLMIPAFGLVLRRQGVPISPVVAAIAPPSAMVALAAAAMVGMTVAGAGSRLFLTGAGLVALLVIAVALAPLRSTSSAS